ncbi:polyprenyl synthetase family protein [Streptomyces sp. NPDC097619]|uniref:polyprenyl synthetase family protein n=1 Tax=Streptomyces sp. NPDC097619 TaxID=3157228 RepID=UPI00332DFA1F
MSLPAPRSATRVDDLLARARARTDAVVRDLLERVEPGPARILAYQWGWQDAEGRELPAGGPGRGKAVRAALVFAAARACGDPDPHPHPDSDPDPDSDPGSGVGRGPGRGAGPAPDAAALLTASAAAVELLHALSLLHDDVMDGDALRRGRPAAWRVFGAEAVEEAVRALTPHALDLAFTTLPTPAGGEGDPGDTRALRASAQVTGLLGEALVRLAQGQALDLALEEEPAPEAAATLRVHADKTGSLFACACALGAVPAAPGAVDDLAAFGEHLGIAFQIVDDLLGIWGDPAVTGKPAGADLTARKKSHPVAVALAPTPEAPDLARRLRARYALPRPWTERETREVRDLLDRSGAREVSRAVALAHERAALAALDRIRPASEEAGRDLRTLAAFVTDRSH